MNEQQSGVTNVQPEVQMQQAYFTQPEMVYNTTMPENFEPPKKSKKKKVMTITALIVAILILIGGTSVGVWAFISSKDNGVAAGQSSKDPKASATGNIFQYMNKISQAKKIEGEFDSDGEISTKAQGGKQKINFGVESGTIKLERSTKDEKPKNFFSISGTLNASTDSSDNQIKSVAKMIDGEEFEASLSGDMEFKWSAFGRANRQTLSGEQKKQAQTFFMLDGENKESVREMRDFLLKGYEFKVSKNGDETIMTLNKSDLKAIAEKMEENVKNDQNKFKELYFKATKDATERTFNDAKKRFLAHEMSKGIEKDVLSNLQDFEYKVSYKDKGDRIEEKSEFKLEFSVQEMYKVKFNLQASTTYIL